MYKLSKKVKFYFDFLDMYFDRRNIELIEMDTDSNHIAISGQRLEDIVRPELRADFYSR